MAKSPKVNRAIVKEVRKLLKPLPVDVIGHIEGEALCCRNGTVAMVKIDRSDPAWRSVTKKSKSR